ncbi:MAG: flippase-like domain-containing protein [Chloroflexi bacterium]|nr:flippase-like domain-containing protein [Chloroflexota bacterium]
MTALIRYRPLRLALFLVGLALLFGIVNHYGFEPVFATLMRAQGWWILGGLGCYSLALLLRSWKWHHLLLVSAPGSRRRDALALFVLNQALGNLTPGRAGEMIAPFMIRQRTRSTVGGAFAVLLVDRFLELNFLLLLMVLAIVYFLSTGAFPDVVARGSFMVLLLLSLLVAMIGAFSFSERTAGVLLRGVKSLSRGTASGMVHSMCLKAEREGESFYQALKGYKTAGVFPLLVSLTAMAWLLELLSFIMLVNSVGQIPFMIIAAGQVLSFAAGLVSLVPNGIGVTALSFVFLVDLMGYPGAVATSGALLGTIVNFGLVILLAAIFSFAAPRVVPVSEENR